VRAVMTEKCSKTFRLTKVQIRRSYRTLRKQMRRMRVAVLVRLFRAQQTSAWVSRQTFSHANRWSATLVSSMVFVLFVALVQDTNNLKTSETHLTCAQVIGAALALILSLSIIPAQRAAEAFSPAVLKLYAKDHWLVGAFLILAFTTATSVLLGTNFLPQMDARISVGIQFLLLGISFDALRIFYARTLDLLIPQTAIQLIIRECTKLLNRVARAVEKLTQLQALAFGNAPTDALRAIHFSASQVSGTLRFWIAQLEEIAHKLIARRDTSAARDIVVAMGRIGTQYSEARRNSLILIPDFDNLLVGGVSDISEVLNPIYESIRVICEDAAKAPNEPVVTQGIQTLAAMTLHSMTMVHSANGWKRTPLAFSGCYWLGQCATIATKANMGNAAFTAITGFQNILLAQKSDAGSTELEAQALESLLALAVASYAKPDAVWGFPAVRAMLLAARHDIVLHGYRDISTLEKVLEYLRSLAPLEIAMERAGKRMLQTFPPYDLSFEASVPALLEMVAHRVAADADQPWNNPFSEFLAAAEDVRHHYRELSKTNFENTLAQKWVVDSLIAAARVHWGLIVQPPAGTEAHIDDVDQTLRYLISWLPSFFPEQNQPHGYHIAEAADSLACLGISLLEQDRMESARGCASAIAGIASNVAAQHPEPYILADLHQRIEVLARAADALGKPQEAITIRAMTQRPTTVSDENWPHYLEARHNRLHHLDRSVRERRNRYAAVRDDPVAELQRILNRGAA